MYSTAVHVLLTLYMISKFELQYTMPPLAATVGPFISSLYDYM